MKKLNEYLDNSNSLFMKELYATYPVLRMFIGEMVLSAQKDAYNQAIEDADEAIIKSYNIKTDRYDYNGHNISKLKIE